MSTIAKGRIRSVELEHRGFGGSDSREGYVSGWDAVLAPSVRAGSS